MYTNEKDPCTLNLLHKKMETIFNDPKSFEQNYHAGHFDFGGIDIEEGPNFVDYATDLVQCGGAETLINMVLNSTGNLEGVKDVHHMHVPYIVDYNDTYDTKIDVFNDMSEFFTALRKLGLDYLDWGFKYICNVDDMDELIMPEDLEEQTEPESKEQTA